MTRSFQPRTDAPRTITRIARERLETALVLAIAVITSFAWLGAAPLDGHEVLVVETATEMHERGDWITPYFNGAPRLKKPPLNYWLTGLTGRALGRDQFTAIDGRIPSALAGVALVAVTIFIGSTLWTRGVGLGGGLILALTIGFVEYTHSARPEMVYAALSMGGLAFLLAAWRRRLPRAGLWIAWALFGLAVLCKGPQVPALLVGGLALALALHPPSRPRLFAVLMPVRGILLAAAVSGWWWAAVATRVGDEAMASSQLLGSRFLLGPGNLLDPEYLYSLWPLLLPWLALWPALVRVMLRPARLGWAARVLTIVVVFAVAVLCFGDEKRDHYLLPFFVPLSLLMALGARRLIARRAPAATDRRLRLWLSGAMLVVTAGIILAVAFSGAEPRPTAFVAWLTVLGTAALALAARSQRPRALAGLRRATGLPPLLRLHALLALPLVLALVGGQVISGFRLDERMNAGRMIAALPPGHTVGALDVDGNYLVYYGDRRVENYVSLADLLDEPAMPDWLVTTDEMLRNSDALGGSLVETARVPDCRGTEDWVLLRWTDDAPDAPAEAPGTAGALTP